MDRSRVMTLIAQGYKQDAMGQMVPTETRRDVFCNVTSVTASEFFAAAQTGLKPELRATLFGPDYQGEEIVELDGVRYGVYRTYLGKKETVELYLERKVGVAHGENGEDRRAGD